MLRELIEIIGYDNMIDTVKEKSKLKENSIYIRVPLDREIEDDNDILITGKTSKKKPNLMDTINNFELYNWFLEREFYTLWIDKNKCIDGSKGIHQRKISTNQKNVISIRYENVKKAIKDNENVLDAIIYIIKRYLDKLDSLEYLDYYIKAIDKIKKYNDLDDKSINIYLDKSVDEYSQLHDKYVRDRIIDSETGIPSIFCTLNSQKPFLAINGNPLTKNTIQYTKDEAIELYWLNRYVNAVKEVKLKYGNGYIYLNTEMDKQSKNFDISEYRFIENYVYPDIFKEKHLIINNLCKTDESDNEIYDSHGFYNKINTLINSCSDKNKIESFTRMFEIFYSDINLDSFNLLKSKYKQIFKNLYHCNEHSNINIIKDIYNLEISLEDYINKTKIGEELMNMFESVKDKIAKMNEYYNIEDDNEFAFMSGQLATYLKLQSEAKVKTHELIRTYLATNDVDKIFKMLDNDLKKYGYKLTLSSRFDKIYSGLIKYQLEYKINKVNDYAYRYGLLSNNLMFTKKEN